MNNIHNYNKSVFAVVYFYILLITLTSCSSVNVTANQASLADDTESKTVVALWWGGSDVQENVDCNGNGLKLVRVSTNWLYSLCTVVTLGAVAPFEVEYRCTTGELDGGGSIGYLEENDND